ncbi:MAG TPA: glycerol dehydrogenase [Anaerovoracaceae bacterium]|nr:glycerol dehydrogenase [Anaerovoracaceae bacterium]
MSRILKSPSKYVQGFNTLEEIDKYLEGMGNKLLVIISESGIKRIKPSFDNCFKGKEDYELRYEIFRGESTEEAIMSMANIVKENDLTAVIGVGGGKIIDTAKAVAHYSEVPMVIVPTVASTDSPCSSLSILYKDNGEFDRYLFLSKSPDMVLVDTNVIVKAPSSLLVAGMGDALATYFEARACRNSGSNNQVAGKPTKTATAMAAMCWDILKKDGAKSIKAIENKVTTEAVENIVEVNTYLSSVGFESGGLGAAHAIQKGFTFIPELHNQYHGNKVAFCTIAQLVLENAAEEELYDVISFCDNVGLPICFSDMGYDEVDNELLMKASEKACAEGSTIHNMPFEVKPYMVYSALLTADTIGKEFKNQ